MAETGQLVAVRTSPQSNSKYCSARTHIGYSISVVRAYAMINTIDLVQWTYLTAYCRLSVHRTEGVQLRVEHRGHPAPAGSGQASTFFTNGDDEARRAWISPSRRRSPRRLAGATSVTDVLLITTVGLWDGIRGWAHVLFMEAGYCKWSTASCSKKMAASMSLT